MARYTSEERLKMRRALKVGKTLAREMNKRQLSDTNDSETEDVDFTKVIHPLGHYMNDRKQMIEEMFSIIKGEKLKRMLPPLLRSDTLEELKADCLVHLLGMSKKRINAILEGRDICSSSDTESESEDDREKANADEIQITETGEDDLLDISVSKKEMDSLIDKSTSESKKSKSKSKEQKLVPLWSIVISDDEADNPKIKKEPIKTGKSRKTTVHRTKSKNRPNKKQKTRDERLDAVENGIDELVRQVENDTTDEASKGKTLLEILELEMRARAIRALLKSTSTPDPQEPVPVSILNLQPSDVDQTKTNDPVAKKIVEVMDKTLGEDGGDDGNGELEDVELIEIPTADLCVTIDDDDDEEATKNEEKSETELEAAETEIKEEMTPVLAEKRGEEKDANDSDPEIIIDITSLEDLTDEIESESSTAGKETKENTKNDPSWSERWAKSKNVEKVIKNSKLCANIRKRMRFARMKKQKELEQEKETMSVDFNAVDENSVAAYNLIKEMDKSRKDACQPRDEIDRSNNANQSQNTDYPEASSCITDETLEPGEISNSTDEALEPGEIRDIPIPTEMTDNPSNEND